MRMLIRLCEWFLLCMLCSLTESLGEIPALEAMLHNLNDIKVNVYQWRWSSQSPWPPLKSVLATQLWSNKLYQDVRDRLLRPAPSVQLITGGQFVTVDTRGSEHASGPEAMDEKEEPPLLDPETAVCSHSAYGLAVPHRFSFFLQRNCCAFLISFVRPSPQEQYRPERSRFPSGLGGSRNAGLIHMMPMDVGVSIPDTILALKFSMVVVELDDRV